jgi:hypothetical protein
MEIGGYVRTDHSKISILGTQNGFIRGTLRTKNKKCRGQGVLEFVLVSASIIFFIFMFVNLSYVFLVGEYIDYSVYMSARSLYAGHQAHEGGCTIGSPAPTQECMAILTLRSLLHIDSGGVFGPLVKFKTTAEEAVKAQARYPNPKKDANLVRGVKVEYEVPLFLIPPLGILKKADISRISHVSVISETYLDRAPTQDECYNRLHEIMTSWFPNGTFKNLGSDPASTSGSAFKEASDNGC